MRFRLHCPLWMMAAVAAALPLPTASAEAGPLIHVHDVKGVDLGHVEDGIARDVARDLARDLARDAAKDLGRDRELLRRTVGKVTDRL